MEHQYPVAITGDEHMLAELMLPDQAHVRNQDWTIFFLHKDTSQEEEEAEIKEERRRRRQRKKDKAAGLLEPDDIESGDDDPEEEDSDSDSDSEPEGGEGPPLIYVLNLVNTKQDKTARRGAVVKAMAICTRHPFLHIYKVRMSESRCGTELTQIAIIIISLRRIFQITTFNHPGLPVRSSQHHGFITYAATQSAGETSPASE